VDFEKFSRSCRESQFPVIVCNNIQQDFFIFQLYTTIPHPKLQSRLKDLVTNSFRVKSGKRRYSYIVVHGLNAYFVKDHTNNKKKYTEDDIVNMINFLTDNIFIESGGRIFQQNVGIPMGTNSGPLLADLFLHSYKAEFVQELLRNGEKN